MEEPLTLIQRINRVNYFADQIMSALNNSEKREAFLNKEHSGYRQSTVDAIYLTFSRLKQEILQEKEQANPNEFHLLDDLMSKLNHIIAIFEPIANKSKSEGGGRRNRNQRTKKTKKYGRKRKSKSKTKRRKNI